MAITRKSAVEFASILSNAIKQRNSSYDTAVGPIRDIYIEPTASALEVQSNSIYQVQQLLTLANGASFTAADLDAFVYNESMVRNKGGRAKVELTFQTSQIPQSDVTIRAGFAVATTEDETTGISVTFTVDSDTTLYVSDVYSHLVTVNGAQYVQLKVPATASVSGTIGNVGPYRVVRALRPMPIFSAVFNEMPASGGTNLETNAELIRRYLTSIVGSSPSVIGGIEKIIRSQFNNVQDMNIVYGNSVYNLRSANDGGAVDVYLIGETQATATDYVTYTGPSQTLKLSKQPVISIDSVMDSVSEYVQYPSVGASYKLEKDAGSYAGSNKASDGVYFIPSAATLPALGTVLTVEYKYNSLPASMLAEFSKPDRDVPGRSLLFKEAMQVDLSMSASIKVRSGFNVISTKNSVRSAILSYVNSLKLGEPVEASDIQAVVRRYTGVDNFVINNLSRLGSTGVSDVTASPFEYMRIADIDLTLQDLL